MTERILEKGEENEAAILGAQTRFIRAKVPVAGVPVPENCDCGEPIPDGRRALGYPTCTFCSQVQNGR